MDLTRLEGWPGARYPYRFHAGGPSSTPSQKVKNKKAGGKHSTSVFIECEVSRFKVEHQQSIEPGTYRSIGPSAGFGEELKTEDTADRVTVL